MKLVTTAADGFYLATGLLPADVLRITGLSDVESWGRWSDARVEPVVVIHLADALPTEFTLAFEARGLGRNSYQDVVIEVGDTRLDVRITSDFLSYRIPFAKVGGERDKVSFRPLEPVSPNELGMGVDHRMLGIGLVSLRLTPGIDADSPARN
jgi:phosphoglycerol transferase